MHILMSHSSTNFLSIIQKKRCMQHFINHQHQTMLTDVLYINVQVAAYSAIRMKDIRSSIGGHLIQNQGQGPALDGIILMTNSDITDIVFDAISSQNRISLLNAYTVDLLYVINAALNASVNIAVSSPIGALLEGPFGAPDSVRFHDKKEYVRSYTAATEAAADRTGVVFVDMQTHTRAAIPFYRMYYSG